MKVKKKSIKKLRKYKKKQRCLRKFTISVTLVEYYSKPVSDVIDEWAKFIEIMSNEG